MALSPTIRGSSIGNAFSFVLASDLHTEFIVRKDASGKFAFGTLFEPNAPFLALVGDVGAPVRDVEPYRQVLQAASVTFQHVWLLSGNHEFYNPSSRCASRPIAVSCLPAARYFERRSATCSLTPRALQVRREAIAHGSRQAADEIAVR
jgi:hypothetical protein